LLIYFMLSASSVPFAAIQLISFIFNSPKKANLMSTCSHKPTLAFQ